MTSFFEKFSGSSSAVSSCLSCLLMVTCALMDIRRSQAMDGSRRHHTLQFTHSRLTEPDAFVLWKSLGSDAHFSVPPAPPPLPGKNTPPPLGRASSAPPLLSLKRFLDLSDFPEDSSKTQDEKPLTRLHTLTHSLCLHVCTHVKFGLCAGCSHCKREVGGQTPMSLRSHFGSSAPFDRLIDCETVGGRGLGSLFCRRLVQAVLVASFVQVVVTETLLSQWRSSSNSTSYDRSAWWKNAAMCIVCRAWTPNSSKNADLVVSGKREAHHVRWHPCPAANARCAQISNVHPGCSSDANVAMEDFVLDVDKASHRKSKSCRTCFVQSFLGVGGCQDQH